MRRFAAPGHGVRSPATLLAGEATRTSQLEWRRLLCWPDTSGLALHFERIIELKQAEPLPREPMARLQFRLAENTARINTMRAELNDICSACQIKNSMRFVLLPLCLPVVIVHAQENETQLVRMRRYCAQARCIICCFKLHVQANLHYRRESLRLRQQTGRLAS